MPRARRQPETVEGDVQPFLNARRRRLARYGANAERVPGLPRGSIEELRHFRQFAAECVVTFGEWTLPIFERLDAEVTAREGKASALERARQLAGAKS